MSKKPVNYNLLLAGMTMGIKFLNADSKLDKIFIKRYRKFLSEELPQQPRVDLIISISQEKNFLRQINRGSPQEKSGCLFWTQEGRFFGKIDYRHHKAKFYSVGRIFYLNRITRLVFAVFNLQRGGIMLHASSVAQGDKAYVFLGKAGVGKSTIAKISEADILSDDSAIIFPQNGQFYVSTTAFDRKLKSKKILRLPLKTILKISRSKTNRLSSLEEDPVSSLFNHGRPNLQFFKRCPKIMAKQFENCVLLAKSASIKSLKFKKDNTFWPLIND